MTGGRPLRFLVLTLGGWVLIRIAMLLPEIGSMPAAEILPRMIEVLVPDVAAAGFRSTVRQVPIEPAPTIVPASAPIEQVDALPARPRVMETVPTTTIIAFARRLEAERRVDNIPSAIAPPVAVRGQSRLNGSAWVLVRGGPAGTVSGGQLGASQGGVRLTYALGTRRRFALAARIAAPLKGAGREAALGVEWQPTRLPIRLIAEQRFVLDGGRGGPTVGVIGGYGPSDIAWGLRLEAYGQAGAIARGGGGGGGNGVEGFVDASARLTHPLGTLAGVRVDAGLGAWGSAQRAAERFDVGPSIVATVPVARKSVRLTLDWRERIAGAARPGSGLAFSIGSDF